MLITAAQHIFTNVEKNDSPLKERGFQTLYYSKEYITEEEKMALEEHAYFWATPKNQFYMLEKKAVITNIVPLKGSDKYGGEGLYISHGLILEPEEFMKIGNNPMILLYYSHDLFCKSSDSAISRGDFDTGNIDPVEINIPDDALQKIGKAAASRLYFWKQEEVRKLAAIAVRAGQMAEERESVAVAGEQKEIEDILRYVFLLLPSELKLNCSFDTNYYNPRMRLPYSWCGGFFEDQVPESDAFLLIEKRIIPGDDPMPGESPYLNWLLERINNRDYRSVQENKALIFDLEKSLGDSVLFLEKIKEISPTLLSEFVKCNKSIFHVKVRESLEKTIGKRLGEKSAVFLTGKIGDNQEDLLRAVSGDVDLRQAVESVVEMLSRSSSQIPDEEMLGEMKELYGKTDNQFLRAIIAFYEKSWQELREAVRGLSEEEFINFLNQTIVSAPGEEYFDCVTTIKNISIVTDIFYEVAMNNDVIAKKLPGFLAILTRLTLNRHLERFKPLLEKMSSEEKKQIAEGIRTLKTDFADELLDKKPVEVKVSEPVRNIEESKSRKTGGFLDKIWPFSKKQE